MMKKVAVTIRTVEHAPWGATRLIKAKHVKTAQSMRNACPGKTLRKGQRRLWCPQKATGTAVQIEMIPFKNALAITHVDGITKKSLTILKDMTGYETASTELGPS